MDLNGTNLDINVVVVGHYVNPLQTTLMDKRTGCPLKIVIPLNFLGKETKEIINLSISSDVGFWKQMFSKVKKDETEGDQFHSNIIHISTKTLEIYDDHGKQLQVSFDYLEGAPLLGLIECDTLTFQEKQVSLTWTLKQVVITNSN